jgi:hypothetical protein
VRVTVQVENLRQFQQLSLFGQEAQSQIRLPSLHERCPVPYCGHWRPLDSLPPPHCPSGRCRVRGLVPARAYVPEPGSAIARIASPASRTGLPTARA